MFLKLKAPFLLSSLGAFSLHTFMLNLVSKATFTQLTVQDVKAHLNVTSNLDDAYLSDLLAAAVDYCERETQMDWSATTWDYTLGMFPGVAALLYYDVYANLWNYPWISQYPVSRDVQRHQALFFPRGPLQSITSISYYDQGNTLQTLTSSNYYVYQATFLPARIEPAMFWPIAWPRPDAVTVRFVSGFNAVPARGIHALRLLVGTWFRTREELMSGQEKSYTGSAIDSLLGTMKQGAYA